MTSRDDDDGSIPLMLRLPESARHLPDRGANSFVTDLELLTRMELTATTRTRAVGRFWRATAQTLNPPLTAIVAAWMDDPELESFALLVESLLLPSHAARRMANHGYRSAKPDASDREGVGSIQRAIQQDEARLRRGSDRASGRRSGAGGGNRPRWVAQALLGQE